jgi:hypothetical protein
MTDCVEIWRRVIVGSGKTWVAFEHGTCVIFAKPPPDAVAAARALLREWGPVHAGTPAGDFQVVALANAPGWVVGGHHPDILTYVAPEAIGADASELMVGLLGRAQRDRDAEELNAIHVEQGSANVE